MPASRRSPTSTRRAPRRQRPRRRDPGPERARRRARGAGRDHRRPPGRLAGCRRLPAHPPVPADEEAWVDRRCGKPGLRAAERGWTPRTRTSPPRGPGTTRGCRSASYNLSGPRATSSNGVDFPPTARTTAPRSRLTLELPLFRAARSARGCARRSRPGREPRPARATAPRDRPAGARRLPRGHGRPRRDRGPPRRAGLGPERVRRVRGRAGGRHPHVVEVLITQQNLFAARREFVAGARHGFLVNTLRLKQAAGSISIEDLRAIDALLTANPDVAPTASAPDERAAPVGAAARRPVPRPAHAGRTPERSAVRADPSLAANRSAVAGPSSVEERGLAAPARAPLASVNASVEAILAPTRLACSPCATRHPRALRRGRPRAGRVVVVPRRIGCRPRDRSRRRRPGRRGAGRARGPRRLHLIGEGRPLLEQPSARACPPGCACRARLAPRGRDVPRAPGCDPRPALVGRADCAWRGAGLLALVGALPAAARRVPVVADRAVDTAHALAGRARPSPASIWPPGSRAASTPSSWSPASSAAAKRSTA